MPRSMTRREVLRSTLAAAVFPLAAPAIGRATGLEAPSQRVRLGFIGCGRQTYHANIPLFMKTAGVDAGAVCDVDAWRLEGAVKRVRDTRPGGASGTGAAVATHVDYRRVLDRKDIDAVMISTPDHWHAKMAVDAMRAGKDVALEKPITRTIREGQDLVKVSKEEGRIFRVDSEFRSGAPAHRATTLVRNGYIGKVQRVVVGVPKGDVGCPPQKEMPVPAELDYERWQGPAPRAPYTQKRVHPPRSYGRPGWMRHLYYCDGMITNWGTHLENGAMWATGTDRTGPVEVEGKGTFPPPESFWNVLLDFDIRYRFADGTEWIYRTESPYFRIEGSEGWVKAGFSAVEAEPKSLLTLKPKDGDLTFPRRSEKQDFVECVRSRRPTLEPAEVGHRVTSLGLLGHIAIWLGERLRWDPVKEEFSGNEQANAMRSRPIQAPPPVRSAKEG